MLQITVAGHFAEIFLSGAHLRSWQPAGHGPVLWMSGKSNFTEGAAIRGGVPICFPWFGVPERYPDAAHHGFARTSRWELIEVSECIDTVTLVLRLRDTPASRRTCWPYRFEATYTVTIGAELVLTLEVENRDEIDLTYETALHTYYAVGDAQQTRITGLEGLPYLEGGRRVTISDMRPLRLGIAETGRRYDEATGGCLDDPVNGRVIAVTSQGSRGVIIWNPGQERARDLIDFEDGGWTDTICLETCNLAESAVRLRPGDRHRTSVTVAVSSQTIESPV